MLVLAAVTVFAAALAGSAIATRGFGLNDSGGVMTPDVAAQQRCERDVVARMVSPESASVSGLTVTNSELDPEITDLAPLGAGPLAGVDRSTITVRSVTGVVETPNEMGGILTAPFTCRAYFIGDELSDSLVVLEHDH
jgi:hypothetical protein